MQIPKSHLFHVVASASEGITVFNVVLPRSLSYHAISRYVAIDLKEKLFQHMNTTCRK